MTFKATRWLFLVGLTLLLSGCMIPLPPHRTSTAYNPVAHRNDAEGHCKHSIIEKRKTVYAHWLFDHHGRFFREFEATWFHSYGFSNHLEHTYRELPFLEHSGEGHWQIVSVQDSKSWLAYRTLDWSPSGSTEAIVVFNDLGEWHQSKMQYVKGLTVGNGGREVSIQTVDGTRIYKVLNNRIEPDRDYE